VIKPAMYLIDTNVISEIRKRQRANAGVRAFFSEFRADDSPAFLSVITVGELRRGVELIRQRGDKRQASRLERWLQGIISDYAERILDFTAVEAQLWGRLRVPHHQNAIDKQIAATALTYDLTLVTRNTRDFEDTGVKIINPFD
jgi:predicted nucleic acid-binding protein